MIRKSRFILSLSALVLGLLATAPLAGSAQSRSSESPVDRPADTDACSRAPPETRSVSIRQLDRTVWDAARGRGDALRRQWNTTSIVASTSSSTRPAHLRDHQSRRQVIANDVEQVLLRGSRIDEFMRHNQMQKAAENSWLTVRRDLDELAARLQPPLGLGVAAGPGGRSGVLQPVERNVRARPRPERQRPAHRHAVRRGVPAGQRQRVEQDLLYRLDPPAVIALDRNGRTISLASSMGPRTTFDIDGRARSEPNGYWRHLHRSRVVLRRRVDGDDHRQPGPRLHRPLRTPGCRCDVARDPTPGRRRSATARAGTELLSPNSHPAAMECLQRQRERARAEYRAGPRRNRAGGRLNAPLSYPARRGRAIVSV